MVIFKDLKSLFKHIEKDLQKGMKDVGEEVKEIVQKHVETDVYGAYSPSFYQRTYELRDSIDFFEASGKKGEYAVIIQHDTGEIDSHEPNQHYSIVKNYNPKDVSDFIPLWVHEGMTYPLWRMYDDNGKMYEYLKPRRYMDNAYKEIDMSKVHIKALKKSMKDKGYRTK